MNINKKLHIIIIIAILGFVYFLFLNNWSIIEYKIITKYLEKNNISCYESKLVWKNIGDLGNYPTYEFNNN